MRNNKHRLKNRINKIILVFFTLAMTSLFAICVYGANQSTLLVVNNTALNEKGKSFDGKFLVPARGVYEAMGADVKWENETKTLTVSKDGTTATIKLGSSKMNINGTEKSMEHTPIIYDNTTLIAAANIGEPFGYVTAYDKKNDILFIYPSSYTYICTILPANSFSKVIKDISDVNAEYERLYAQAPENIIYRNVTGLIIEYPANPFPSAATIYNIKCKKDRYYVTDMDKDDVPELIIKYISDDGRFDDYAVYTCKNNTLYYCGNIRNVLDGCSSDDVYVQNDYLGVFVYDFRADGYVQVILDNKIISRGKICITKSK